MTALQNLVQKGAGNNGGNNNAMYAGYNAMNQGHDNYEENQHVFDEYGNEIVFEGEGVDDFVDPD